MMRRVMILCAGIIFSSPVFTQYVSHATIPDSSSLTHDSSDVLIRYAQTIQAEELKEHLSVLASDAFEGRETGTVGNELAAAYIANQFRQLGLPAVGLENSYYQTLAFNRTGWSENEIVINDIPYRHLWDYLAFAGINHTVDNFRTEEVVFLGYGIDDEKYSDYKGNDLSGKVIMINKGEPVDSDSISYITGSRESSEWNGNIWKKLETASRHGVKLVLIIENDLKSFLQKNRRYLVSASLQLGDGEVQENQANHVYISTTMAREIIGKKDKKVKNWRKKNIKKGKAKDIKLCPEMYVNMQKNVELIRGNNVLGYIEGTDKKEELVVISAHYDHLGKRGNEIFNGADDNGSGTSTLLEMAEAFKMAASDGFRPKRSLLFLLVTGEEKGLLGSKYYAENPMFPLENTIANVNVDMIGRTDEKYESNSSYVYVIGSDRLSSELHKINEKLNDKYSGLILDYKYNDPKDPNRYYYRSDHYNFARKGIPAIFFFSGTHEDYHQPGDTADKIMYEKMETIGRHIFYLTWELANREDKITVDGKVETLE